MAKKHLTSSEFLEQLQMEAALQSTLNKTRIFPAQLNWFTSLVGRYPWQLIALFSGISALIVFHLQAI